MKKIFFSFIFHIKQFVVFAVKEERHVPSSYLFELKLFISIKGSHERISMEFRVWLFNLSAKQYFLDRRKQLTVFRKKIGNFT